MKGSELQIGDLVQGFVPDSYSRVYGIFNEQRIAVIAEPTKAYIELSVDDIQPILLTPEILEKNGFKYNDESGKYAGCTWYDGNLMLHLEYDFRIVVTNDFDDESTNRTPFVLRYVHQLQHVYKLLGIDKEIIVC